MSAHCIPKSLTYCTKLDRGKQQIGSEQTVTIVNYIMCSNNTHLKLQFLIQ